MNDQFKGKMISEFLGLKSKVYFLTDVDNKNNKKTKRINKKAA